MSLHRRSIAITALGLALTALSLGAPAAAALPLHEVIVEEYAFTAQPCDVVGLEVAVEGTVVIGRTIRLGADGLDYFIEHVSIRETHTANGVTTTYTERSVVKDLKLSYDATTGLLDVIAIGTGNATLSGPDGKAIARDPGQTRFHIVYDVVNDVDLLFERIKGSTGRTDDFCAAEMPLFVP